MRASRRPATAGPLWTGCRGRRTCPWPARTPRSRRPARAPGRPRGRGGGTRRATHVPLWTLPPPSFVASPAVLQAPRGIVAFDAGQGLVADHGGPGVDEARRLLAGLGVFDSREHTLFGHLLRELHDGGGELAVLDVLDAFAAAVDRAHDDLAGEPTSLQRRIRAAAHRL